jgi:hypothetical protein
VEWQACVKKLDILTKKSSGRSHLNATEKYFMFVVKQKRDSKFKFQTGKSGLKQMVVIAEFF